MATVKKIGTELNWQVEKGVARGHVQNYRVTLLQNTDLMARQPSYKTMVVSFDEINKDQAEALVSFIDDNKKVLRVLNYKVSATFVNFFINEGFKGLNPTNLTEALNTLVEGFRKIGINPPSECVYCNEETTEEIIANRVAIRAHQSCHGKATEELKEYKDDVSYTGGIIGALLGAFVGSLLFTIGNFFFWMIPLLLIPIGLASYFGYKLLGGEFTTKAKWIIVGASLVVVIGTILFGLVLDAWYWETTIPALFGDPELGYSENMVYVVLWGLAGVGTGYQLAKRREF